MTASIIANELHLPLYVILMDKIVTKYMGETSAKLRQIFDYIEENPAVNICLMNSMLLEDNEEKTMMSEK